MTIKDISINPLMNKFCFISLFFIWFFSFSVTAGNNNVISGNHESIIQDKGTIIYISRPDVYAGSLSKLDVSVNGVKAASMQNNSTFIYPVQNPGNLTIRVSAAGVSKIMARADEITIVTEKNKSYFVEVGWTNSITQPIYIKQVAYEQIANRFPELTGQVNHGNMQAAVTEKNKELNPDNLQTQQNLQQAVNKPAVEANENNMNVVAIPVSDIDKNIPATSAKKQYLFALIIGNEDYSSFQNGLSSEVNVAYARNDAKIFKEYAIRTLGTPEENTILLLNARAIEMNRAITKMNLLAKNSNGKAEIIVYYAGHGFPDEVTKEPYLMPVDVSGSDLQFAVKLNDLYTKMTEFPVQKVTIFLDACFSGGGRGAGLVAARGVKIRPKETSLSGNLAVFTSSSGDQSSLSYKEQQHGMFTYFLLKKLQETKGKVTYKELADYLSEQVGLNSIRINDKEQNPQVNISPDAQSIWETWSLLK
jgi:hypothetical protein